MSDDPFLSARGLTSGCGLTCVLQDIDFDMPRGSAVTLIGRNNVNRATMLRSTLGSVPPPEGITTFNGTDITTLSSEKAAREDITLVPEECRAFPGLTASGNVEIDHIGGRRDAEEPTIDTIVDEFENFTRHRNSRGANLSGGEQQILAIARALVSAPDLLLFDEPTEGFVPAVVKRVQQKIRELNDDGMATDGMPDRCLGVSMAN